MATELRPTQGATLTRSERVLEDQLLKVESQLRLLDIGVGVSGALVIVFGYALGLMVVDRFLVLSSLARQAMFVGMCAGVVYWCYRKLWLPLTRPINPVYAAVLLERTIPDAKNSVINWVDLKEESIPESVRHALGRKAARDVASHEGEEVISMRNFMVLGTSAGALFFILAIMMVVFGKNPFLSILGRTFTPFVETTIATRNSIQVLKPEMGDAVIAMGSPVDFEVKVSGKLPPVGSPESPRLMLRYHDNDPWQSRYLETGEFSSEFKIRVPWSDVRSGFSYMVAAGDAKTNPHRVDVRLTPLISDFQAVYKYRRYTGRESDSNNSRKIEAPVGTEVFLRVRANSKVKDGVVHFVVDKQKPDRIFLARNQADPQLLEGSFVLRQTGEYRIEFTTAERDVYQDTLAAPMIANPDKVPAVAITLPGKETVVAANGVLNLEGKATDDFGLRKMTLRMVGDAGRLLMPKPFRDEKAFMLPSGGNPTSMLYHDFVDFSTLQTEDGLPYTPKQGSFVDYWLEAEDGSDQPKPNLGKSKVFRVTVASKQNEQETKKQKDEAQKQKNEGEKKQDENNKNEDQKRQQEKQEKQEQKNQESKENPGQQGDKSDGQGNPDKKDGGKGGQGKGDDQSKGDQKGQGSPQDQKGSKEPQNEPKMGEQDFKDQERRLNEALEKNDKNNQGKDDKNPMGAEKSDSKGQGDNKPNDGKEKSNQNDSKSMDKSSQSKDGNDKSAGKDSNSKDPGGKDEKSNQPMGKEKSEGANKDASKNGEKSGEKTDPKNNDMKGSDTKGNDTKAGDPKGNDPKSMESKPSGDKGSDPKGGDKSNQKKEGANPDSKDGKDSNQKGDKPMGMEPNGKDSKTGDKNMNDPKGNDPKGNEKNGMKPDMGDSKGQPMGKDSKMGDQGKEGMKGNDPGQKGDKGSDSKDKGEKSAGKDGMKEKGGEPKAGEKGENKDGAKPDGMGKPMEGKDGKPENKDGKDSKQGSQGKDGMGKPMDGKGEQSGDSKKGEQPGKDGMGKDGKGDQPGGMKPDGKDSKMGKDGMGDQKSDKGAGGDSKKGEQGKGPDGKQPGDMKGDQPMGKDQGMGQEKGKAMGKEGEGKDGKDSGKPEKPGTGDNPGVGGGADRKPNETPGIANPNAKNAPDAASEENKRKAVDAQIENYKKRINGDVLKDAKMSPEDIDRFLKAKRAKLEEEYGLKKDDSTLPASGFGKGPSMGGSRFQSGTGEKNDTKAANQAAPPAPYRNAYKEFTKKLTQPEN